MMTHDLFIFQVKRRWKFNCLGAKRVRREKGGVVGISFMHFRFLFAEVTSCLIIYI